VPSLIRWNAHACADKAEKKEYCAGEYIDVAGAGAVQCYKESLFVRSYCTATVDMIETHVNAGQTACAGDLVVQTGS
jgi:hypothetical protein